MLRRHTHDDAALVRAAGADAYITSVTTVPPAPASDAEVVAYIARQHSRLPAGQGVQLVIEDQASGVAVGQIGLMVKGVHRAAIGYWVDPGARRRGYAGRAARVLSAWALGLPGLHRLEASVEPWNEGSMRAVESAGFVREGVAANWELVAGEPRDMVIYAKVPDGHRGWEAQAREFQTGMPLTEWNEADREGRLTLQLWAVGSGEDALLRLARGEELTDADLLYLAWLNSLAIETGYRPPCAITPGGARIDDVAQEILLKRFGPTGTHVPGVD